MEKSIRINFAVILFILYLAALGLLCFLHGDNLPNITGTWHGFRADDIVHAIMFLPFVPLAYISISFRKATFFKSMLLLVFIASVGACTAYATELIQGELKYRTYELRDFVSDCVGLAAGFAIVTAGIILKYLLKRLFS